LSSLKIGDSEFFHKKVYYIIETLSVENEGSPGSEQILESIILNKDVNKE
jgi:hypothetical protein